MKGKLIGKGLFSKVYEAPSNKVIIESVDSVKECFAIFGSPNRLIAPITRLDYSIASINSLSVSRYEMQRFEKITAPKRQLNTKGYELYKELRFYVNNEVGIYDIRSALSRAKISNFDRDRLNCIVDVLSDYGEDMAFEISPRNIAASKTGRLILLDCFFFFNEMIKMKNRTFRIYI